MWKSLYNTEMVLIDEVRPKALIKNLYLIKGYGPRKSMSDFPDKNGKLAQLTKYLMIMLGILWQADSDAQRTGNTVQLYLISSSGCAVSAVWPRRERNLYRATTNHQKCTSWLSPGHASIDQKVDELDRTVFRVDAALLWLGVYGTWIRIRMTLRSVITAINVKKKLLFYNNV